MRIKRAGERKGVPYKSVTPIVSPTRITGCEHNWETYGMFFPTQRCRKCGEWRRIPLAKFEDIGILR